MNTGMGEERLGVQRANAIGHRNLPSLSRVLDQLSKMGKLRVGLFQAPDGKRIPKSLDWGRANGLNENDPKWIALGHGIRGCRRSFGVIGWNRVVGAIIRRLGSRLRRIMVEILCNSSDSEAESWFVKAERAEERHALGDAVKHLLQAAKLGHTGAQVNLGNWFSWGKGVPQSDTKAAYWYRRAFRAGDESGAFNLGIEYLNRGNKRSAIFWFKRAVNLRSGEAALELAKIYLRIPVRKPEAIRLLQLAQVMKQSEISEQAREDAGSLLSAADMAR